MRFSGYFSLHQTFYSNLFGRGVANDSKTLVFFYKIYEIQTFWNSFVIYPSHFEFEATENCSFKKSFFEHECKNFGKVLFHSPLYLRFMKYLADLLLIEVKQGCSRLRGRGARAPQFFLDLGENHRRAPPVFFRKKGPRKFLSQEQITNCSLLEFQQTHQLRLKRNLKF